MDFVTKDFYSMADLLEIVEILRGENGCPWDRKQTHRSVSKNMIEEAYEVVDAILRKDVPALQEELGDVLLQVVFHAQMETEKGSFTFEEVVDGVAKKLVFRHPHVFGDQTASDGEAALATWEEQKKLEKHQKTDTETLQSVPKIFPSLMRADKVLHRAKKAGIAARTEEEAYAPLEDATAKFYETMLSGDREKMADVLSDVLFSAAKISQYYGFDSEKLLTNATEKFINRFDMTERLVTADDKALRELEPEERNAYWERAGEAQAPHHDR